jgi:hypothetical protein
MAGFGENRFPNDGGVKDVFGASPNMHMQYNRGVSIPTSSFVFTVDTTQAGSASDTFVLPLNSAETYNFTVKWGDDTEDVITTWNQAELTHVYSIGGTYQVQVEGTFPAIRFAYSGDRQKFMSIDQWGTVAWETFFLAFRGCSNMVANYSDTPNIQPGCSMSSGFRQCDSFNGTIEDWNWANVSTIAFGFSGNTSFNQPIEGMDLSNCSSVVGAFGHNSSFNQPIENFDVSNVSSVARLFEFCTSLNQPISLWSVGHITSMTFTFDGCSALDQDLGSLNIGSLTSAGSMLRNSGLSTANYNSLLVGWEGQSHNNNVIFGADGITYSNGSAADTARATLISTDLWSITDGGGV